VAFELLSDVFDVGSGAVAVLDALQRGGVEDGRGDVHDDPSLLDEA
jgi:hypothetical protein